MHRDFSLVDLEEEMKSIYIYGKCLLLGELLTLPLTAASSRLQNQYIGSESPRVVQAVQIHLSATSRRTALHRTNPPPPRSSDHEDPICMFHPKKRTDKSPGRSSATSNQSTNRNNSIAVLPELPPNTFIFLRLKECHVLFYVLWTPASLKDDRRIEPGE